MRIVIGADHGGFELKEHVRDLLAAQGHEVTDVGAFTAESVDYPPIAERAARMVASGEAERGILVCGSGNGVAIVANKVPGVRAVNAHDVDETLLARQHNAINVLTLGGRRITAAQAEPIVAAFLDTEAEGGRHERRVAQITAAEGR
jgi:ribose 5-phosphate isomerase B